MLIGPTFTGLNIAISDSSVIAELNGIDLDLREGTLYQLEGKGFRGYVVAGSVTVHEDECGYDEPSALLA